MDFSDNYEKISDIDKHKHISYRVTSYDQLELHKCKGNVDQIIIKEFDKLTPYDDSHAIVDVGWMAFYIDYCPWCKKDYRRVDC